MAILTGITQLL